MPIQQPIQPDTLPPFPNPDDDEAPYDMAAYAWGSAQPAWAAQVYAVGTVTYDNALAAAQAAQAADDERLLAQQAVVDAGAAGAAQVVLAAQQAALAAGHADDADAAAVRAADSAASALNAPGTSATSTTSLAITAGSKDLTIQTGKAFAIGQWVIVANTATPSNYLIGQITAYNSSTGALTVNSSFVNGTGTFAAWTVSLTARPGASALVSLTGPTSIYVSQDVTYTITDYNVFSTYGVSISAGSASISGDTISVKAPATAQTVQLTVTVDGIATSFPVVVQPAGVLQPTNASPASGATGIGASPALQSSAFAAAGATDTHASSRWRVYQGVTLVHDSGWRTDAKTSYTVPAGVVAVSMTYSWTVEHRGATLGDSQPSAATSFSTAAAFAGSIGTAGGQGFGVGIYPGTLPSGFSAMAGATDMASANYGNYQYTDGSVMVFIPTFYYRIGSSSSPRFATYGANAIDVVGINAFADEASANAAGYALHRAFKDGGAIKSGFFVDKYLASKNGTTSCKSVQNGNPISLTTSTSYNPSNGMTGCTGILADAVVLARARGAGLFNVASVFIYDALAKLSLAHAQAATGAANCAWYDPAGVTNFPKGCNTALKDTNDATVTFTTAGVSGDNKPLTGSASNLAKTTHNGQSCGVTDINGAMWQAMLGLTMAGTSATDTLQNTTGNAYVLKTSVALASLTAGFGGANDAWGTAANLAANYDAINAFLPWTSTTGAVYFGNGTNQVFSGATSGTDYLRSSSGIGLLTGMSASGTNQFGNDYCYQYGCANLFPVASGSWNSAGSAGVFYRYWSYYRSFDHFCVGFRAAAYGN